jgi:hypothetical protein
LGQGVLLTADEYRTLLSVAGYEPAEFDDDRILDADAIG